jgi:hypothetical protein
MQSHEFVVIYKEKPKEGQPLSADDAKLEGGFWHFFQDGTVRSINADLIKEVRKETSRHATAKKAKAAKKQAKPTQS